MYWHSEVGAPWHTPPHTPHGKTKINNASNALKFWPKKNKKTLYTNLALSPFDSKIKCSDSVLQRTKTISSYSMFEQWKRVHYPQRIPVIVTIVQAVLKD